MSKTRGHKNCARAKCWCCTRERTNKIKLLKATGDKKQ